MAEILVLAEHVDADVKKVTLELITLARRFGEASVVWTGPSPNARSGINPPSFSSVP